MNLLSASPPLRREAAKARHQALQFNGCLMAEGGRRHSRASTPWAGDLSSSQYSLGTRCRNRSQSLTASHGCLSLAATSSSQDSTSPSLSGRSRFDSEGGDSLDSLVLDDLRATARTNRPQSRERRSFPERFPRPSAGGYTGTMTSMTHSASMPSGYLGGRIQSQSRPESKESLRAGEEVDSWLWLEDVNKTARARQHKAGSKRHTDWNLL